MRDCGQGRLKVPSEFRLDGCLRKTASARLNSFCRPTLFLLLVQLPPGRPDKTCKFLSPAFTSDTTDDEPLWNLRACCKLQGAMTSGSARWPSIILSDFAAVAAERIELVSYPPQNFASPVGSLRI